MADPSVMARLAHGLTAKLTYPVMARLVRASEHASEGTCRGTGVRPVVSGKEPR
jgi:hypothetical protein